MGAGVGAETGLSDFVMEMSFAGCPLTILAMSATPTMTMPVILAFFPFYFILSINFYSTGQ